MDCDPLGKRLNGVWLVINVQEQQVKQVQNENNFRPNVMMLVTEEPNPEGVEKVKESKVPGDARNVIKHSRLLGVVLENENQLVYSQVDPKYKDNKSIGSEWGFVNIETGCVIVMA